MGSVSGLCSRKGCNVGGQVSHDGVRLVRGHRLVVVARVVVTAETLPVLANDLFDGHQRRSGVAVAGCE